MDDNDLVKLFETCSNAGRWGHDDELGTLNFITNEKRLQASELIQSGQVVTIGRPLSPVFNPENTRPPTHLMLLEENPPSAAIDYLGIAAHGLGITHIDAIGHVFWEGRAYNDRKIDDILSPDGLSFGSIHAQRQGIFTRGVLLDIAATRERCWLLADEFVTRRDIQRAEERQQIRVGRGDAVLLHVGLERRIAQQGPIDVWNRAGVDGTVVEWIYEREIAVYSGDCVERLPYPSDRVPLPLHQIGLTSIGLCMLDNPTLVELFDVCEGLGRWEFVLTCAPIDMPKCTGVAVNPLCIF